MMMMDGPLGWAAQGGDSFDSKFPDSFFNSALQVVGEVDIVRTYFAKPWPPSSVLLIAYEVSYYITVLEEGLVRGEVFRDGLIQRPPGSNPSPAVFAVA